MKHANKVGMTTIQPFICAVVVLAVSLSRRQNVKNESKEERVRRLARKQKRREPKCSQYPVKSTARLMSIRERSSG